MEGLGKIGEIIKIIQSIITKSYTKRYSIDKYDKIVDTIYRNIKDKYPDTSYTLIRDIVSRFLKTSIQFKDNISDINFREWDKIYSIDELNHYMTIPDDMIELEKHFMDMFNTPQPEQRTQEWFDYRYNRITASDMATAIDKNPYESVESFICKKCNPNFPFLDNDFVFHGKKYEQIATSLYEHIYNSKVTEFGCLPSDKYKILGASPDGIGSKSTLDYKINKKLGYMLEIKCPYVRKITMKGKIAGEICPFYYYCQVQQQLECCNLDYCDFIQCKLEEYKDREEYLSDVDGVINIYEDVDGKEVECDQVMRKGYLMQFLPKVYEPSFEGDKHHYKSFYIYPPRLTMNQMQYDEWVFTNLGNWKTLYPDKADSYYFDKVIYWKIIEAHTVTIPRDKVWFNSILPILEETWSKVLYYREHSDELPALQAIADKRKKFYRMNTKFQVNNVEIGTKFLEKDSVKKKKEVKVDNSDAFLD